MRLHWTVPARNDLAAINSYVAEDSPQAAARLQSRIRSAVAVLEEHPYIGRPSRRQGARDLVIPRTPYIVLYRVRVAKAKTFVEILRVIHGARDWR